MSITITCDPGGGGPGGPKDPRSPGARGGPKRRPSGPRCRAGGMGIGTLLESARAGGVGTSGTGWNSTRSTSEAVSPSIGATLCRSICGSGLIVPLGALVPAPNNRSIRRPTSAVIISMRRLTSVALSVASRCAASSKACTDDTYEKSVTIDNGTTDSRRNAIIRRVRSDIK